MTREYKRLADVTGKDIAEMAKDWVEGPSLLDRSVSVWLFYHDFAWGAEDRAEFNSILQRVLDRAKEKP